MKTPQALLHLLANVEESWELDAEAEPRPDNVDELLACASKDAQLPNLRDAPRVTWTLLAKAGLFRSSLANIEAYRAHVGAIDTHLAILLEDAGHVYLDGPDDTLREDGDEYDRETAAVAILNATDLTTATRARLAASIQPARPLPLTDINPSEDDLFALLLDNGLVADEAESFAHFHAGGWDAIGPAIKASDDINYFIEPPLVHGMVADPLSDPDTAEKVGFTVISEAEEYLPDNSRTALMAVAAYAGQHSYQLPAATVVRIARVDSTYRSIKSERMLEFLSDARPPASADDIVAVFEQLGDVYSDSLRPERSSASLEVMRMTACSGCSPTPAGSIAAIRLGSTALRFFEWRRLAETPPRSLTCIRTRLDQEQSGVPA